VCVHFCRLRKEHSDPTLALNGKQIPVVEETKFLGLVFDRKLTFVPYLWYLRTKCLKALNLLRVVAHTSWGGAQQTLLHLYRSLIRSKLDYGCIVYGSTRNILSENAGTYSESCTKIMPRSFPNFPSIQFMHGSKRTALIPSTEKIISAIRCENKLMFYELKCQMCF